MRRVVQHMCLHTQLGVCSNLLKLTTGTVECKWLRFIALLHPEHMLCGWSTDTLGSATTSLQFKLWTSGQQSPATPWIGCLAVQTGSMLGMWLPSGIATYCCNVFFPITTETFVVVRTSSTACRMVGGCPLTSALVWCRSFYHLVYYCLRVWMQTQVTTMKVFDVAMYICVLCNTSNLMYIQYM